MDPARSYAGALALLLGLGCAAPPPVLAPGTQTRLVCDPELRPGHALYLNAFRVIDGQFVGSLAFTSVPTVEVGCREIQTPAMPELPPLDGAGLVDGPGIVIEAEP